MGTGEDQSSSAAFGLGEEQLARSLSVRGGFGLTAVMGTIKCRPSREEYAVEAV